MPTFRFHTCLDIPWYKFGLRPDSGILQHLHMLPLSAEALWWRCAWRAWAVQREIGDVERLARPARVRWNSLNLDRLSVLLH